MKKFEILSGDMAYVIAKDEDEALEKYFHLKGYDSSPNYVESWDDDMEEGEALTTATEIEEMN